LPRRLIAAAGQETRVQVCDLQMIDTQPFTDRRFVPSRLTTER